jgi:hypothetical protein
VRFNDETVTLGYFILKFFDSIVPEFRNGAAERADKVVMVLTFSHMFIAGLTIAELDFAGNARLGKKFQSTVDRGITNVRMPGPELQIKLFDAHMPFGRKKRIEDNIALTGGLEPFTRNELLEYLFFGFFQTGTSIESEFHNTYHGCLCQYIIYQQVTFIVFCRSPHITATRFDILPLIYPAT